MWVHDLLTTQQLQFDGEFSNKVITNYQFDMLVTMPFTLLLGSQSHAKGSNEGSHAFLTLSADANLLIYTFFHATGATKGKGESSPMEMEITALNRNEVNRCRCNFDAIFAPLLFLPP